MSSSCVRSRVVATFVLIAWSSVSACGDDNEATQSAPPPPTPTREQPTLDQRDQYALAEALHAMRDQDIDAQAEALPALRAEWEGRRYRWQMMRVAAFCANAEQCLFAPFDVARFAHPVSFAFLPKLRFRDADFGTMTAACAAHTSECVVTFEATLSTFALEAGTPTSLTLTDAHFVAARARQAGEFFLSRPAVAPPAEQPPAEQPPAEQPSAAPPRRARSAHVAPHE